MKGLPKPGYRYARIHDRFGGSLEVLEALRADDDRHRRAVVWVKEEERGERCISLTRSEARRLATALLRFADPHR